MTNKETPEEAAFESSVDYKPFEDNLSPKKYYEYGFIKGAEWQAEKSYTKEEVIAFAKWMYDYKADINKVEEWLEQFKK